MAVIVVRSGGPRFYLGLSSDTKPTATASARFFETDTSRLYIADGSAWGLANESGLDLGALEDLWPLR